MVLQIRPAAGLMPGLHRLYVCFAELKDGMAS